MSVYYGKEPPKTQAEIEAAQELDTRAKFDLFFEEWWPTTNASNMTAAAKETVRAALWNEYQQATAADRRMTRTDISRAFTVAMEGYRAGPQIGGNAQDLSDSQSFFQAVYGTEYSETPFVQDIQNDSAWTSGTPPERIFNTIVDRYDIAVPDNVVSDMEQAQTSGEDPAGVFAAWLKSSGKLQAYQDYVDFNNLFTLIQTGQLEGENGLYAECLRLTEQGKDWMVDGLASGKDKNGNAGVPTSDSIFGILKDYNVNTYKIAAEAFGKAEETAAASEALMLESENNRINWVQKLLGRPMTSTEQTYIRITDQVDASDVASHEDIAMIYWMFGGASSTATAALKGKAEAKWQSIMANDTLPIGLRAEYADFAQAWKDYESFAKAAFDRATESDINKDVRGYDQLVSYDFWNFDEWVSADMAVTALRKGYMMEDKAAMTPMQEWLEAHGMSGLSVTGLLKAPGESQADYEFRIRTTYVAKDPTTGRVTTSGEDMLAIMEQNALVVPSNAEILEEAMPQIMEGIKAKVLPGVAPEQRQAFMNQMQMYIRGESEYSSSLWKMYGQIAGGLTPSDNPETARLQINNYVQGFLIWASKNDYFSSPYIGNLPSLQQQMKKEAAQAVPTRMVAPKSFGLGV